MTSVLFCEVALSFDGGRARATVAFHLRCVRSDLNEHGCVYGLGLARVDPTRAERERCMDVNEKCVKSMSDDIAVFVWKLHYCSARAERERCVHFNEV